MISVQDLEDYLLDTFDGVVPTSAWGETSFFYNPGGVLKRGVYFCTAKSKDGENDKASGLDAPGRWRLNIGLPADGYDRLFGSKPARPAKGGIIAGDWDFLAENVLTPHPVYGWMGWVAVVSPSSATFETCKPLLASAFAKAKAAFDKRVAQSNRT